MDSFTGIHLKSLRFQQECVEVLKIQLAGYRHGIFHRLNFDDINKISFFRYFNSFNQTDQSRICR